MHFSIVYFSTNKKVACLLFFGVLIIASFFYLWQLNKFPLTDYDEATYAQVTRDTLESGDILTLKRFDKNWFEKPPLYFWMAMASTSVFGTDEFAYRLPSAFMAILGIAVLWLLVKKITKDSLAATAAAIFLLVSSFYFISARQVRLDIPAITMIMASLTAL